MSTTLPQPPDPTRPDPSPLGIWRFAPLAILVVVALTVLDPMVADLVPLQPAWLRGAARALTELGQATAWLIIAGVVGLVAAWRARRVQGRLRTSFRHLAEIGQYAFVSIGLTGLSSTVLKYLIGRARPRSAAIDGYLAFRPFALDVHWASFPSGHATVLFAVAFTLGRLLPAWRGPFVLVAAALATTRVLVGAHHPADVLAAALLAAFGTWAIARFYAARHAVMAIDRSGAIGLRGRRALTLLARREAWR